MIDDLFVNPEIEATVRDGLHLLLKLRVNDTGKAVAIFSCHYRFFPILLQIDLLDAQLPKMTMWRFDLSNSAASSQSSAQTLLGSH
jgi:hypothetical protein